MAGARRRLQRLASCCVVCRWAAASARDTARTRARSARRHRKTNGAREEDDGSGKRSGEQALRLRVHACECTSLWKKMSVALQSELSEKNLAMGCASCALPRTPRRLRALPALVLAQTCLWRRRGCPSFSVSRQTRAAFRGGGRYRLAALHCARRYEQAVRRLFRWQDRRQLRARAPCCGRWWCLCDLRRGARRRRPWRRWRVRRPTTRTRASSARAVRRSRAWAATCARVRSRALWQRAMAL
jgi:hypothetical protein